MVLHIILIKTVGLYVLGYTVKDNSALLLYSLILVSIAFWLKRKSKILVFYFYLKSKLNMQTKCSLLNSILNPKSYQN